MSQEKMLVVADQAKYLSEGSHHVLSSRESPPKLVFYWSKKVTWRHENRSEAPLPFSTQGVLKL